MSHYAVNHGAIVSFHYMLEFNLFDFDAKDRNGNTPLHLAIEKSKFDIAKEIIHLRPALAKEKNKLGHTPMHICALKGTYDHCTFGWNMLEICGNIILEIKDLEDLTPVKLANHKNPVKDTCGSKDACKDTKCSDKKESVFGQTFSKFSRIIYGGIILLAVMMVMKNQGHRIPHPCALPNPIFKGFFLATSTTCFLSFIFNIYPKLSFDYSLISLLLQFPYAILIKVMLNADAYEVLQSDRHEGIEAIISKKYKPYEYCGPMKMILPPQQTKYCKMTKKAIRGFDHHCLFLEKSIGHGTHHYFMLFMMTQVANQFWYVYCLYYMAWPPAGMETALAVFCCFGFCSGSFLIAIQLRCILCRGTQYFPGKSPPSLLNIFEFFFRHEKYAQSLSKPHCVDHV